MIRYISILFVLFYSLSALAEAPSKKDVDFCKPPEPPHVGKPIEPLPLSTGFGCFGIGCGFNSGTKTTPLVTKDLSRTKTVICWPDLPSKRPTKLISSLDIGMAVRPQIGGLKMTPLEKETAAIHHYDIVTDIYKDIGECVQQSIYFTLDPKRKDLNCFSWSLPMAIEMARQEDHLIHTQTDGKGPRILNGPHFQSKELKGDKLEIRGPVLAQLGVEKVTCSKDPNNEGNPIFGGGMFGYGLGSTLKISDGKYKYCTVSLDDETAVKVGQQITEDQKKWKKRMDIYGGTGFGLGSAIDPDAIDPKKVEKDSKKDTKPANVNEAKDAK